LCWRSHFPPNRALDVRKQRRKMTRWSHASLSPRSLLPYIGLGLSPSLPTLDRPRLGGPCRQYARSGNVNLSTPSLPPYPPSHYVDINVYYTVAYQGMQELGSRAEEKEGHRTREGPAAAPALSKQISIASPIQYCSIIKRTH